MESGLINPCNGHPGKPNCSQQMHYCDPNAIHGRVSLSVEASLSGIAPWHLCYEATHWILDSYYLNRKPGFYKNYDRSQHIMN